MVIEQIISSLPRTKQAIERFYANCSNLKKFITVDNKEFSAHLEKAKSDLASVETDFLKSNWDWVIIKSYYSMHHAINALLVKSKGYYSKDHICAIITLKYFELLPEDLYKELRKIDAKFSDFTGLDISYSLRKISQYDIRKWKEISRVDADIIYKLAKEILSFVEQRCYA